MRKKFSVKETQQKLAVLRKFVDIAQSDRGIVDKMVTSNFSDLEDAMQFEIAVNAKAEILITRN